MKKGIKVAIIAAIAASLAAAIYCAWPLVRAQIAMHKKGKAQERIANCSELITYKCNYTSIVYKDKALAIKKNTKGYSAVRVKGVIMGGIEDLGDIKLDISEDGKGVKVSMPHCKILENGIESEEGISETGTFLRVKLEDVFTSIDNARAEVEADLIESGFLDDADKYAQEAIKQIMTAVKFSNVEVKYE